MKNQRSVDEAEGEVMKLTNFDHHLKEQLADPAFAKRFNQAGRAWDVAFRLASLRRRVRVRRGK
jgi:hypothetical protein